jgi:hypothetical protein
MKATPQGRQGSGINFVDETSELMVISQFGKIIRIDTKSIRAAGRFIQCDFEDTASTKERGLCEKVADTVDENIMPFFSSAFS